MTGPTKYRAPTSRQELLDLLAHHGAGARILAGGTDLLVDIRNGSTCPELLLDVKRVAGYSTIGWSRDDGLVIGPAVTINQVLRDARIHDRYPLLATCAEQLASYQIRNRATVVGNVVNASPCADMAPALLCLGAHAVLSSDSRQRVVAFADFFRGVKRTLMEADEILEAIHVPAQSAGARGGYLKLKRISGHDLGIVGVALLKQDGQLRLGISSCAPTPVLVDGLMEGDTPDHIAESARKAIHPITDLRATREYREFIVDAFVRRLLQEVP